MSINFTNATLGDGSATNINAIGHIIQVVEAVHTGRLETSNTSAQNFFTASITLQKASNGIAYYYNSAQRCDVGNGPWNLGYHQLLYVNNDNEQLFYSGYNGFTTNNIIHFAKIGVHYPGSIGPHNYQTRVWAYPGSNLQFNSPQNQGNDGRAMLRLMEIGS